MGSEYDNNLIGAASKAIEKGKNTLVGGTIGAATGLSLKGVLSLLGKSAGNLGKGAFFVAGSATGAIIGFATPVMADVLNPSELGHGELPKDQNGNAVMPQVSSEWQAQLNQNIANTKATLAE